MHFPRTHIGTGSAVRRMLVACVVAALSFTLGATSLEAQSPESIRGIGSPAGAETARVDPTDASTPGVSRLTSIVTGDRSIVIDAEFAGLPGIIDGRWNPAADGMQRTACSGINLPAFTRELGLAAERVEILSVESIEQQVAGVRLSSLEDAPLTGDSARDRALAAQMRPPDAIGVHPDSWASVAMAGRLNGRPLSVLTLTPYRFDAARGLVLVARRMKLRIQTSEPIDRGATESLAAAFGARARKPESAGMMSATATTATTAPDGFEYKVFVDRDGVFRMTPEALREAGLPLETIDTRTLKLYCDGIEQPVLVVDRGDHKLEPDEFGREYIEFFGERRRARGVEPGSDLYFDQHARYSVYFLTWGGSLGKRLVEESGVVQADRVDPTGDLTGRGTSFLSTIHLEEDKTGVLMANAELNTLSDRFDRKMWGAVPPNEMKTFPVVIPHPNVLSQRPIEVRGAVRSSLRNSERLDAVDADHDVEIYVDGFRSITATVPAVGLAILNNRDHLAEPLLPGKLRTGGANVIALANRRPSPRAELTDAYLNWLEITYPRLYVADGDSIEFSTPPQFGARYATFRIRRFVSRDIRVYRRGISRIANVTIISNASTPGADSSFDVQFQVFVASESERFYAVSEANIMTPVVMRDTPSDLLSPTNAADFLVIVDDVTSDLATIDRESNPLRRFIEFKRRTGFQPKLVRATDIYDEFNGGVVSPFAIKAFIAHAWRTWSTPPRYAMIFGSGRAAHAPGLTQYPPAQREIVAERSYVPTIMLQTVSYGATECDYLLGCVDGEAPFRTNLLEGIRTTITSDLVAEVVVGRVPLNRHEDIAAYVDKLIEQQSSVDASEWRGRALMIGGWEYVQAFQLMQVTDDYFRHVSEPYRFIAADNYATSRYRYGADRSIMDILSSGVGVVTYLGHGGGGQWEETAELNLTNAASLRNRGKMGSILSLTCFTGAYDVDGGLIGRLLVSPNGGAIQAFGTPGFGWLRNNGLLADAIFSVMHNPRYRGLSFGEILTLGKAIYVGTHLRTFPDHVPTVASMYTVFGDPSLTIPYATDTVAIMSSDAAVPEGARFGGTSVLPFPATRVSATAFDTTEMSISGVTVDVGRNGDRVDVAATVPAGYAQPYIGIRLFASDDAGRTISGALRVPTGARSVSIVLPAVPLVIGNDAIFDIEHHSSTPLDSVKLSLRYDGVSVFDSVAYAVTSSSPSHYRTAPIPAAAIEPGAIIDVRLPTSTTAASRVRTFRVEGGADPAAFPENATDSARQLYGPRARMIVGQAVNPSISMESTPAGPRLVATAYNWGDRDAVDVPWRLEYDSARTTIVLGSGAATIPARGSVTIPVDVGARIPIVRNVRLLVDPDGTNRWVDGYRDNNSAFHPTTLTAAMVRSGVGTTADGSSASAYAIPSVVTMSVAPGDARADGIVSVLLDSAAPASEQRWALLPIGAATATGLSLRLIARGIDPATPLQLTFGVGAATVPPDARIVRYDSTTRLWLAHPTTIEATIGALTATVPATGVYAIARVSDNVGPRIRFAVEGQFYLDSSAVPADARFSAVLLDESGIDTRTISATLDGVPLELGRDIVWIDSTITASSASVRVQKPVADGTHSLCVTASDRVGNERTECTSFEVDGELALRLYGNFPNPFTSETFIAYELRGATVVDDIELKIFSTSGRLVRTFRFPSAQTHESLGLLSGGTGEPTSVGYHEAWWDGRDDQGREVANGVYFYRLRVSTDDREIEELGTLARIR